MPIPEQFSELVVELLNIADSGEGDWVEGSEEDSFVLAMRDFGVTVSKEFNPEKVKLRLYSGNGTYIDGFTIEASENATYGFVWKPGPEYAALDKIWSSARHKALRVDQVFSSAIASLRALREGKGSVEG